MKDIREFVKTEKNKLKMHIINMYEKPTLYILQVGDHQASNAYIKGKIKDAEELGIEVILKKYPQNFQQHELVGEINKLNTNFNCSAMIVQLPLPEWFNEEYVLSQIDPSKDVDGFLKTSEVNPCTPTGIMDFLENGLKLKLTGKNALVIGRSNIVGKPMVRMLLDKNCTVSVAHSKTKISDLKRLVSKADIIICAVGKRNMLNNDEFKFKKSAILIDVGINRNEEGKLCGDCESVSGIRYKSPVPGGVGLLTRLALYKNLISLKEKEPNYPIYIKTLIRDKVEYKVYLDDYGQQFFFVYKDENGESQEVSCGSYETDYKFCVDLQHKLNKKKRGKKK